MDPNDTINEAIKLIDPKGMLVPGTRQHDRIREMIEIWLGRHSPEEVLEMARNTQTHKKGRASKRLCQCNPVQDLLFIG